MTNTDGILVGTFCLIFSNCAGIDVRCVLVFALGADGDSLGNSVRSPQRHPPPPGTAFLPRPYPPCAVVLERGPCFSVVPCSADGFVHPHEPQRCVLLCGLWLRPLTTWKRTRSFLLGCTFPRDLARGSAAMTDR